MNKRIAFISLTLIGLFFVKCSENVTSTLNEPESDRLSFATHEEFSLKYSELSKFTTIEELQNWAQIQGHSTLLNSEDSSALECSDVLKTLLNKDAEYEIGNSIIWYYKGKLYEIDKQDINNIKTLKAYPDKLPVIGIVGVNTIYSEKQNSLSKTRLTYSELSAKHQYEFNQQSYQPCGGAWRALQGKRKYVHEVKVETIATRGALMSRNPDIYSYSVNSSVTLRIKLEYRGSDGWKAAGEQREVSLNISGSAVLIPSSNSSSYSFNQTYDCSKNVSILLKESSFLWNTTTADLALIAASWDLTMNGTIQQHVKGDATSNTWVNTGSLW